MIKDFKNVFITFALVAATFFVGVFINSRLAQAQDATGQGDLLQQNDATAAAEALKQQRIAEINAKQELLLKEQGTANNPVNVTSSLTPAAPTSTTNSLTQSSLDVQAAARQKAQQDYVNELQQTQQAQQLAAQQAAQQAALEQQQAQQLAAQQAALQQQAQMNAFMRTRRSSAS